MFSQNKYFIVTSIEGKNIGSIKISNFEKIRINVKLINKISNLAYYKKKNLQKRNIKAGTQTSSQSWGTGRALARLPRVKGEGTGRSGQASIANMCRGGRVFIPLKQHRKWYKKVNRKSHFQALLSCFIASTYAPLVLSKGHNITDINYFPLILEDLVNYSWSSFEVLHALKNAGGLLDIKKSRKVHIKSSKLNNYKKGPLFVLNKKNELYFLLRNIYNLETTDSRYLSINQFAPSGRLCRLSFFTKSSFVYQMHVFGLSEKKIVTLKKIISKKKSSLKYKKYQKTIKLPIKIKGIGIHSNNQKTKSNIENKKIPYKNLFQTINKDYNTPLYSFYELEFFLKAGHKGFQKSLNNYKNKLYKKNFELYRNNNDTNFNINNINNYTSAQIEHILNKPTYYITLEDRKNEIRGVEHLLSALEALSIDNVLIDLHGGNEIPILDGSSLLWINEILNAGLEMNQRNDDTNNSIKRRRKIRFYSKKSFSISHNDSFISYYPANFSKITTGVDFSNTSPIIGKQWFSYDIFNDNHYRWEISPSRMYLPTIQSLYEGLDFGYFKGGVDNCINLSMFDKWYDNEQIRFCNTECARHEILDLIGCLSLLSNNGNGGIPLGHIISYKPSLELNIRFIKLLKELIIT